MTCCVAALCDKSKSIILASDRMIDMGIAEAEPEISKMLHLHRDWVALIAGNGVSPAFPIEDAVRETLAARNGGLTIEDVETAVCDAYNSERAKRAEAMHLAPIGWSLQKLNSPASKILPKSMRVRLLEKVQRESLGLSLLVAGFDGSGKSHLFTVADRQEEGACSDRHNFPGFSSIGSGSDAALLMMMHRSVGPSTPLRLMVYYAFEAKRFGEIAGGVGEDTEIRVWRSGERRRKLAGPRRLFGELDKLFDELRPRKLEEEKQINVLNEMSVKGLGDMPKLRLERRGDKVFIREEKPSSR
jgi:hypothetical protein